MPSTKQEYGWDAHGFFSTLVKKFHTVNTDGTTRKKRSKRMKFNPRSHPPATKEDITRLEAAILAHEEFRAEYHRLYNKSRKADIGPATHPMRRDFLLRYCWDILNWRPSGNNLKVFKRNPNNHYIK